VTATDPDTEVSPFCSAATALHAVGWQPIPLPPRRKAPPPGGFTGYGGSAVTADDVARWCAEDAGCNVAVRAPDGMLGLDVDAYDGKRGAETWQAARAQLGELPATVRTTARGAGSVSGIRWYRVPAGRRWADAVGADVEVIHYGHRYAVVAPSVHPDTGEPYATYDDRLGGVPIDLATVPLAELPELPSTWVAELDRGPVDAVTAAATGTAMPDLREVATEPDAEPCKAMGAVLDQLADRLGPGSHHRPTRDAVMMLCRLAEQGHHGVTTALAEADRLLCESTRRHGRRYDPGKVTTAAEGAARKILLDSARRTSPEDRGCCGELSPGWVDVPDGFAPTLVTDDTNVDDTAGPTELRTATDDPAALVGPEFWAGSRFYACLLTFARARDVSPLALLMCLLARASAYASPAIVLDKYRGAYASLNLFVALSTPSGGDKSVLMAAAADFLDVRGGLSTDMLETGLGTGEGLLACYCFVKLEKGKPPRIVQHRRSVLLTLDEVSALEAVAGRKGSTAVSFYTSAWSAALLTTQNADPRRMRRVEPGSYRLAIVSGVQPLKADIILDDSASGFAQRWLWTPTNDPYRPAGADDRSTRPAEPGPYVWRVPGPFCEATYDDETGVLDLGPLPIRLVLRMPPEAVAALSRRRNNLPTLAALRAGSVGTLDAHALQLRARVAALLALLHERTDASSDDWQRAGLLLAVSTAERTAVLQARGREASREADRRAVRRGRSEVLASESGTELRTVRCMQVIRAAMSKPDNREIERSTNALGKFAPRYRDVLPDALARLVESGELTGTERQARNGKVTTYYRLTVPS
jgi:hypothetical protein